MLKIKWKTYFIVLCFLVPFSSTQSQSESNNVLMVNETYHIEITASQWQFEAIDLHRLDDLVANGMSQEAAREAAVYNSKTSTFLVGKTINFAIRSKDVQHGFSFIYEDESGDENSIQIASIRPNPGEEFGQFVNASIVLPSQTMKIVAFCHIFCGLGHPDMKLEFQITGEKSAEALDLRNTQFITSVVGITIMLGLLGFKLYSINARRSFKLALQQKRIISEIFHSRTSLYYYVMGQKTIKNGDMHEKIQEAVPKDIYKFKFLLHPVRLSLTKVLYENLKMTSVEMKEILGLSWNEVNTHLNALQKKGYIHTTHDFIGGSRKQVVSMEPYGIEQYKILVDLLHLFLDNVSDYQFIFEDE